MHGGRGAEWSGIPGGRFSLGRLKNGSGYCLGNVVESRMGVREEKDGMMGETRNELRTSVQRGGMGGNGMRDVWVIGEGFFRGVGAVFDVSPANPGPFQRRSLADALGHSYMSRKSAFGHSEESIYWHGNPGNVPSELSTTPSQQGE